MERTTKREEWIDEAVRAIRSAKPVEQRGGEAKRAPTPSIEPPPMTAREWIRLRDQRALDLAYTQSVAAEIALRWTLRGGAR